MKSKPLSIIILFIIISIATLFFILWLVDFSQLNIPELIPGLETRVYGVLILISFILIFIFLQKTLLKSNPQTSVLKLIIASTIVSFISLLIYQAIRELIILRGQYSYDLGSVLSSTIPTIAFILVAASIALELKKVKGLWIWRHVPTVVLVILFYLTRPYLHKIEW
jgi:hypothetical protein